MQPTRLFLALAICAGVTAARAGLPEKLAPLTADDGRLTFDIVERLRYEDRENNVDFDGNARAITDDTWLVQRLRLGATWKPNADVTVQVQLQDAREIDARRPAVPFIQGAEGDDPLDLRLATVTWGNPKTSPVQFTLGRQTLGLGEERLIGSSEWNNFARVFDGGKLVWNAAPDKTVVTAFVASVVNINPSDADHGWKFNKSDFDNDLLLGLGLTHKFSPRDTGEAYLLRRDKQTNDPIYSAAGFTALPAAARTAAAYDIAQDVFTLGARFVRAPKPGAFDLEFEGAWQIGDVARQTTTATGPYAGSKPELEQNAWAVHALLGYTPENMPGKLRVNVEYNVASGDSHRSDDQNNSFMSLFPSNHKFYGFIDAFSWKNLEEFVATVRFVPVAKTAIRIDWHEFKLFTTSDGWYRANGVSTVRPVNNAARAASRDAGSELDVTGTWTPLGWATFDFGYCRFNAGKYLGATGNGSDADFYYLQTTIKF